MRASKLMWQPKSLQDASLVKVFNNTSSKTVNFKKISIFPELVVCRNTIQITLEELRSLHTILPMLREANFIITDQVVDDEDDNIVDIISKAVVNYISIAPGLDCSNSNNILNPMNITFQSRYLTLKFVMGFENYVQVKGNPRYYSDVKGFEMLAERVSCSAFSSVKMFINELCSTDILGRIILSCGKYGVTVIVKQLDSQDVIVRDITGKALIKNSSNCKRIIIDAMDNLSIVNNKENQQV